MTTIPKATLNMQSIVVIFVSPNLPRGRGDFLRNLTIAALFILSDQFQSSDTLKMVAVKRCQRQAVGHCRCGNENVAEVNHLVFLFQLQTD